MVAGIVAAATPELADRIAFAQNAAGAILGPQDAWLLLRGLKTLPLRMTRQEQSAMRLAEWLVTRPHISRVYYPGLKDHHGRGTLLRQAGGGFGAMISFEIDDPARVPGILRSVKVFMFAESLGGVESLITFPAAQTHADMDPAIRERLGINNRLLRLSIGLEAPEDLVADLDQGI